MTQKEKREIIKALKNEIKAQLPIILDSLERKTMASAEFAYYKQGFGDGMKICIDILAEEE